jgi:hypothetical protein
LSAMCRMWSKSLLVRLHVACCGLWGMYRTGMSSDGSVGVLPACGVCVVVRAACAQQDRQVQTHSRSATPS